MAHSEVGTSVRDGIVLLVTILGGLALIGMGTGFGDAAALAVLIV